MYPLLQASILFAFALLASPTLAHPRKPCPEILHACGDDPMSDLFTRLAEANAADLNTTVTPDDLLSNLVTADLDLDGCVNVSEWVSSQNGSSLLGLAAFGKLSSGGQACATGGLNISTVGEVSADTDDTDTNSTAIPQSQENNGTAEVLALFKHAVKGLSDFCESNPELYTSNCDCAQLPRACDKDPILEELSECEDFLDTLKERKPEGCIFRRHRGKGVSDEESEEKSKDGDDSDSDDDDDDSSESKDEDKGKKGKKGKKHGRRGSKSRRQDEDSDDSDMDKSGNRSKLGRQFSRPQFPRPQFGRQQQRRPRGRQMKFGRD